MFLILNVISFLGNSLAVVYLSYDGLSGCEIELCFSMTGLAAILDSFAYQFGPPNCVCHVFIII